MFTNSQCRKSPNIQKILESDYFFKNYDKIQTALKMTSPIKHKSYKNRIEVNASLSPITKQKRNDNGNGDDDNNDDTCDIDKKNKLVKNINCLLLKYSNNEKSTLLQYKKMLSDNKMFHSSYKLFRSKSRLLTETKNPFNSLIKDYAQKRYELPLNLIERNLFQSTPLLMTNSSDIKLYFKGKMKSPNGNKQKPSLEKGVKYLDNLYECVSYVQDGILNKHRTYTTPFQTNYSLKSKSKSIQSKDKRKALKNRFLYKREITKTEKIIKSLSQTLLTMEIEEGSMNPSFTPNKNINMNRNATNYKGLNITKANKQTIIPFDTIPKQSSSTKALNNSNGFLLTGKTHKQVSSNTNFNMDSNINNNAKYPLAKSGFVNHFYKKKLLSPSKSNKTPVTNNNTISIKESKKKTINDVYNSTKELSLFNNPVLAQEITKYFNDKHININHMRHKYKSNQLIDLIASTKDKVQSIDIKSKLSNAYFGNNQSRTKDNIDLIEKLEQRINSFDYNICKCILAEKISD